MNTLFDRKSQSILGRNSNSARRLEVSETHSLVLLAFFTASGLVSVIAAVFTTMLSHNGWRDFWLIVCVVSFLTLMVGITQFCMSYQSNHERQAQKQ